MVVAATTSSVRQRYEPLSPDVAHGLWLELRELSR